MVEISTAQDPLDALARATILSRTRNPEEVRRAVERGDPPPASTDQAITADALRVRGLYPWIPPDPTAGAVLIARGTPAKRPGVAVVGARACDPYGLAVARAAAREAVSLRRSVVSGGAEGCDAAAHTAAMTVKGHTTVVLGAGHDRPYPAHHRDLFERVVDAGGAVLSPFWPETPPAKYRFLARNRVVAALAAVVVVARARRRSGALSTAKAARGLGRPVLAAPGSLGEALSEGTHRLLSDGALPMCGGASLRGALGQGGGTDWPVSHRGSPEPWPVASPHRHDEALGPEGQDIMATLRGLNEADLDTLHRETGLPVSTLVGVLLELEVQAFVRRLPCGQFAPT